MNTNPKTMILIIVFSLAFISLLIKTIETFKDPDQKTITKVSALIGTIIILIADVTTIAVNIDTLFDDKESVVSTSESSTSESSKKKITTKKKVVTTSESTTKPTTTELVTEPETEEKTEPASESTSEQTVNPENISLIMQEDDIKRIPYTADKTGTYGFELDIDSVEKDYSIGVYSLKDECIRSADFSSLNYETDNPTMTVDLIKNEKYYILIEATDVEADYYSERYVEVDIKIKKPL